jgi:hypothetical protein
LIEGDGGHVVLKAKTDHRCCIGMFRITMIYQRLAKVFLICSNRDHLTCRAPASLRRGRLNGTYCVAAAGSD